MIKKLAESTIFSNFIIIAILINAILIGLQTTVDIEIINKIQNIILVIFIVEVFIRWFGRENIKSYITNFWNWFDIIIVIIALIPDSIFTDSSSISALRVLRVFRVIRLFKAFPELQLMVRVLLKSLKSVAYAGLLLIIFMYIYSIIGVIIFKGHTTIVTAHTDFIDPFGSIGEAFFSLFNVTIGWADLRYDLMGKNSNLSHLIINIYYLTWYVLSAFLLINIVFGAIINNYEIIYNENIREKDIEEREDTFVSIKSIEAKVEELKEVILDMKRNPKS